MFQPSLHGWPFANTYAPTGPQLGIGAPPPDSLGLGGGMCWAALDRYLRGVEIPKHVTPPDAGDPLHTEFVQRQVAALGGVWRRVRDWQAAPDGSWRDRLPIPFPFPGDDVASRTRQEWRSLRKRLKRDEPVLLTLLLPAGGYSQPRTVRQVLALGWTRSGQRVILSIYDPDRPGDDDVELAFSLGGPLEARLTGGVPIRGFFTVDYDRRPAPVIRAEPFDDRSVLGLPRTVRGRPTAAAGRKHIDLAARSETGALLHFRRPRGGHWEGVNVTEAEEFGAHELHGDPTAVHSSGALHVFSRSYVGDLLHFRRGRSWSVTNCTEAKKAGARFRLKGTPAVTGGGWGELNVVGRDSSGGVIHYLYQRLRGWRAVQVPGDAVSCDPVALEADGILHVVALAADGRLLHWSREDEWTVTDPEAGKGPEVRLQDPPVVERLDGVLHVAGRDRQDRLAILRLDPDGLWRRTVLAEALAGRPQIVPGPSGLHVMAPTADGGVIHAWMKSDGWTHENIVETRPSLELEGTGPAELACWGSESSLHVFTRRGRHLRVLTWTPDADWVSDPVSERAGDLPTAFVDEDGGPHLVFTDGRGTIIHVETGAWREPKREKARAARTAARKRAATAAAVAQSRPVPKEEPEAEPLPELEPTSGPEGPVPAGAEEQPEAEAVREETAAEDVLDFEAEVLLGRRPADTPEEPAQPEEPTQPEEREEPEEPAQAEDEPESEFELMDLQLGTDDLEVTSRVEPDEVEPTEPLEGLETGPQAEEVEEQPEEGPALRELELEPEPDTPAEEPAEPEEELEAELEEEPEIELEAEPEEELEAEEEPVLGGIELEPLPDPISEPAEEPEPEEEEEEEDDLIKPPPGLPGLPPLDEPKGSG